MSASPHRLGRTLLAAGLILGTSVSGLAVPVAPGIGNTPDAAAPDAGGARLMPDGAPPVLLAQSFGGLAPAGVTPGGGSGPFNSPPALLSQGGRQGGAFPTNSRFGLLPGRMQMVAAFCTDLLSEPPDGATRFTGGETGTVTLADGTSLPLAAAIRSGMVTVRGHNDSFDPIRRDGSLALDLYLANTGSVPVRVEIQAGTTIAPAGQAGQALPAGSDRLFALAAQRRLSRANTLQFAVWAARGSTAEEVEQTQMVRLAGTELEKVQALLDDSGIDRKFDRDRGIYEKRFDTEKARGLESAETIHGSTFLANGEKARVEAVRRTDGSGVVKVQPLKRGGEFYYRARFEDRDRGRVMVKLDHLVTGRPLRANRGQVLLYPESRIPAGERVASLR